MRLDAGKWTSTGTLNVAIGGQVVAETTSTMTSTSAVADSSDIDRRASIDFEKFYLDELRQLYAWRTGYASLSITVAPSLRTLRRAVVRLIRPRMPRPSSPSSAVSRMSRSASNLKCQKLHFSRVSAGSMAE